MVKFICPVPGYDRHFTLLESLGIEMITVPMNDDGPDAEAVARLVAEDPSHQGHVGACRRTPTRPARCAARRSPPGSPRWRPPRHDFKIFWDNAYALHHLTEDEAKSADILTLAAASGHPHRPIMFASTSKITFAGAGVAFLAASVENVAWYLGHLGKGSIGPDKVNQLRHVQFFGSAQGVRDHMVQAPRDHRAEVRRGRPGAHRAPRRSWRGALEQAAAAATSSTSTSCPGPPRGWWRWPRRPASR